MLFSLFVGLSLAGEPTALWAGDETNRPSGPPARVPLREQLKHLTPEERQAKIKEWRDKHSLTNRPAIQRREESSKLSPEQQAKIMALRKEHAAAQRQLVGSPAAEERWAKLKTKLAELHKKQAAGTITPEEGKLIKHLDQAIKRFDQPREKPDRETKLPARKQ